MARIVYVLEIENHQLKEANTNLLGQLAARGAVRDLTQRTPRATRRGGKPFAGFDAFACEICPRPVSPRAGA